MKRISKIAVTTTALVLIGGAGFAAKERVGGADAGDANTVTVARGEIVARALAVGTIEPETEISVKSKVSGVVRVLHAQPGDFVHAGAPLLDIRPDPTPIELAEARRQLELKQLELQNAKQNLDRQSELKAKQLVAPKDFEATQRDYDEAVVQVEMAKEKLQLMQKGSVTIADSQIESTVRSPIDGYVLEKKVEVGDPVVPLSTYQEGTVLMTMADMSHLLFRGTVDEIDVGRLKEGMPVDIKIGALPDAKVTGVLSRISLKAQKDDNATTFPVEVRLTSTNGATLRAGFSANAEIIIEKRPQVLYVPERVVTFEGDSAWVNVPGADGKPEKRYIRTGLSDAINVQVLSGLAEGAKVLEKPTKDVK